MANIQERNAAQQSVYPRSHVGFDSITSQIERKLLKRGFQFNVICVGEYTLRNIEAYSAHFLTDTVSQVKLDSENLPSSTPSSHLT